MIVTDQWHLHRLDNKDDAYTPALIKSFDTLDEAIKVQNKLQGQGVQTQLSNCLHAKSHKIYNLGME